MVWLAGSFLGSVSVHGASGQRGSIKVRGVSVRIRNYEKYKGRGDVKHNSWFRCSNRLLEDSDFFGFSHAELLVWVYVLSLASQKNVDAVFINFDHAERVCRLKKKDVLSALGKLQGNQIDPVGDTCAVRPRDVDDTSTCATGHTGQTEQTGQTALENEFERLSSKYISEFAGTTLGSQAVDRFMSQIKNTEDVSDFEQSIVHYRKVLDSNEWRHPKTTFATYLGTKSSGFFWREFITMPKLADPKKPGSAPKGPNYSEMAKEVYAWIQAGADPSENVSGLISAIGKEKLLTLHRDEFRPNGSVPGLLKAAAEKVGAA